MKKQTYIKATLSVDPTMEAVKKKRAEESLRSPLIGELVITNWAKGTCTKLNVKGALEPQTKFVTKPKKAKAKRAQKKKEQ